MANERKTDASENTARISVMLPPELRDQFFNWCRASTPRRSMSQRILAFISETVKHPPEGSAKPSHAKPPRPR